MPHRIYHLLIPAVLLCLFEINPQDNSTGQSLTNLTYLPLVSHDLGSWLGPYGGSIIATVIDSSNPQLVFAATWGSGVYKSQDGGNSWQAVNRGLDNLYINSLVIDPLKPATLYAGTYHNQVFKSMDAGNTWIWSGSGMQDQAIVYALAIDPVYPDILYAATRGISNNGNPPWKGVVYKSENAGQTWTACLTDVGGADVQDWIYSLAISPFDNNNVYAATHEHGPYHSSTYGETWHPIHDGINDDSGRAIVIDPHYRDGTTMYYGVWHFDTLYKSLDGGNDWSLANHGIGYTKVYNITINPVQTDHVYLATFSHGVLKSLDGGLGWEPAGLQDDLIYSIAINPLSSATVFAGTAGDGLYRSLDAGGSWKHANQGIENTNATSLLVSLSDPKELFSSLYGGGVCHSTDQGRTWSVMNDGLGDKFVHALVQDPANPALIFALTDSAGLYQYDTDSGSAWTRVGTGLPIASQELPAYPADHPLATHELQVYPPTIDNLPTAYPGASINLLAMAFAHSDPQVAYLGTVGSGVYRSSDGGLNWLSAGLAGEVIQSLAVDKLDPNLVYAATSTPGNLKISLDGGSMWTNASLPVTFYSLATSPTSPGAVYAGTSSGIYLYNSGGWTLLGLAGFEVTSISIDPLHPDHIVVGTSGNGAYFTRDAGLTWQPVDRNLEGQTIQSIHFDPTHPNYIYFSTQTHGVYLAAILP